MLPCNRHIELPERTVHMANGILKKLFGSLVYTTDFQMFQDSMTFLKTKYTSQVRNQFTAGQLHWSLLNGEDPSKFVIKASAVVGISTISEDSRFILVCSHAAGKYLLYLKDDDDSTFSLPDDLAAEVGQKVFGKPASFFGKETATY